jgi:hypothetical protein
VKNEDVSRGRVRGLSQWYAIAMTKNGASPVNFWGKLPAATHTLATVEETGELAVVVTGDGR